MNKLTLALASLAVLTTAGAAATTQSAHAAASQATSVYRLYNSTTGEHFYTKSLAEANADLRAGWLYEGTAWSAANTGTAVYRIYNPNAKGGDHYYTKSKYEANNLVKTGWKWDNNAQPVFYSSGNTPVYVAYNPNAQSGAHNFTTNNFEQKTLLGGGWKYGATAWNAVSTGISMSDSLPIGSMYYTQPGLVLQNNQKITKAEGYKIVAVHIADDKNFDYLVQQGKYYYEFVLTAYNYNGYKYADYYINHGPVFASDVSGKLASWGY